MKISKAITIAMFVTAFIGFADAAYLAMNALSGVVPPCLTGGCDLVTTSVYSRVFNIPIALFGALYYFIVLALLVFYIDTKKEIALNMILFLVSAGAAVSLYLVYLQVFVLSAICQYCMVSALTSFVMAGIMWQVRLRPPAPASEIF